MDEATDLIEDLNSVRDDGGELFLGTIIFEDSKEKKDQPLFIVDGQQRITTLLLLLIACRMQAKTLGANEQSSAIQRKIGFIDDTTGKTNGSRLVASEAIRELFDHMANSEWDGAFPAKVNGVPVKRQVNRIEPIFKYFRAQVANFSSEQLGSFLMLIYSAYVFRIDIENDVQALGIFERTNARGIDLEVSDLLKNHLFAHPIEAIEESWKQIADNSDGTLLRMLKYFYISKRGHVRKPDLYKKIKKYGDSVTPEKLTTQLLEFSKYYRLARFGDHNDVLNYFSGLGCDSIAQHERRYRAIHSSLQGLREFGVVQFIPLACAAIDSFVRLDGQKSSANAKALVRLFETLERFHFVNNAMGGRMGNEVEVLYAKGCENYVSSQDFVVTTEELIVELRKRRVSEAEFIARFSKLSYQEEVPMIAYVFDRINNRGLDAGVGKEIYNPDPRVFRKNHNIEHFFSQASGKSLAKDDKINECIDDIGNLLIIPSRTNSKLGSGTTAEKMRKLKGELWADVSDLRHVKEFISEYGKEDEIWDSAKISERGAKLAKLAYNEVWKF